MSMFISPPSDPLVALLWGDRWWISTSAEPIPFGEFSEAAGALLDTLGAPDTSKRIRLIYQPEHLVSEIIECPNGNRATLQSALQSDFPALADPTVAWSFEPINGATNSTVLHYETKPGLFGLVEALTAAGFEVEGVWPMASVLNYVPEDWPDTGALTVLAIAQQRALVYMHTPAGIRQVNTSCGDEAAKLAASAIQQAHESETAAFYFISLDSSGDALAEQIAMWNSVDRSELTWDRLVQVTAKLPATYPHQLIPQPRWFTPHRVVSGVTAAALLLAVVLAGHIGVQLLNQQELTAQQHAEINTLRPEIERLQAQESEYKKLQAELAKFETSNTAYAEFLSSVGKQLPHSLVLTRLQVDSSGFTLAGGVTDTDGVVSDWSNWNSDLAMESQPWNLIENHVEAPSSVFQLKGNWR